jgi:hypothetical protein
MDRLEHFICRRVAYIMADEPDAVYYGTVERDSTGRPYIQDENEEQVVVYDTGILLQVNEA